MSIRRPRTPRPALRHLAFVEALVAHPPDSASGREALAGLLTLRLVDHWVARGGGVCAPGATVLAATRDAIAALPSASPWRAPLDLIVSTLVALPGPDVQPVVPALGALGTLLQSEDRFAMAADVHRTVTRLADPRVHLALAFESQMQLGACLLALDDVRWADAAFAQAGVLATRSREAAWTARVAAAQAALPLPVEA